MNNNEHQNKHLGRPTTYNKKNTKISRKNNINPKINIKRKETYQHKTQKISISRLKRNVDRLKAIILADRYEQKNYTKITEYTKNNKKKKKNSTKHK